MESIEVVAALILDSERRALMVRKIGTEVFMQPGGKPEVGETALQTIVRELHEELGLLLQERDFDYVGHFSSLAANEVDTQVHAEVFRVVLEHTQVAAQAEIAEVRWFEPGRTGLALIAPLSSEHLLPLAWAADSTI